MLLKENIRQEVDKIIAWIQEYIANSGAEGVVIGNSGGKDSATAIAIATKALRRKKCNYSSNAVLFKIERFKRCKNYCE